MRSFLYILKHARHTQTLTIHCDDELNYLAISEESWNNIRLNKLESLHINGYHDPDGAQVCDYVLRNLMQCMDLDKITHISLWDIPTFSRPLQVFENNPFNNLTNLRLRLIVNGLFNDGLNYLSNLTQLIELHVHLTSDDDTQQVEVRASIPNWNWLIKLVNLNTLCINKSPQITFSLLDRINCVKALITLSKLKTLKMFSDILNGPNILLQLFSQLKHLTTLVINGVSGNLNDLQLVTFPTISTLTGIGIAYGDEAAIIPILTSNPQVIDISFQSCSPQANILKEILQLSPSLSQYSFYNTDVDHTISCCEIYPFPLVAFATVNYKTTSASSYYRTAINSAVRQLLSNRIKQHLQPDYQCPNPNCNKQVQ